ETCRLATGTVRRTRRALRKDGALVSCRWRCGSKVVWGERSKRSRTPVEPKATTRPTGGKRALPAHLAVVDPSRVDAAATVDRYQTALAAGASIDEARAEACGLAFEPRPRETLAEAEQFDRLVSERVGPFWPTPAAAPWAHEVQASKYY